MRLILAGNNDRLLDTGEDLSKNDLEAVSSRFLYIKVPPASSEYLRALKTAEPGAITPWIEDDLIAQHALWLRKTRTIIPGSRFIVQGDLTEFHEHLAISSGLASQVCEWLVRYLSESATRAQTNPGVLEGEGEVWINPEALAVASVWEKRVSSQCPPSFKIARTLKTIAIDPETATIETQGQRTHFYRVGPDTLASWAKREGVGDAQMIRERLSRPNPTIKATLNGT